MKTTTSKLACLLIFGFLAARSVDADVVLTFDQSGIFDSVSIDQNYGDRVTASTDGLGHSYDIIAGNGYGLTPNVEASYTAGSADLWTTGYGDLTNVFYDEIDFSLGFELELIADAGFEVGLFGFDMAAFGTGEVLPGINVTDQNDTVLWSIGPTSISGSTRNSFDTGGIFAESITISIDLTGLGGGSDNIGIDNVHFAQRTSAVPEPAGTSLIVAAAMSLFCRRRRK